MAYFNLEVLKEGTITAEKDDVKRKALRQKVRILEVRARRQKLIRRLGPREVILASDWERLAKDLEINPTNNTNGQTQ